MDMPPATGNPARLNMIAFYELMGMLGPVGDLLVLLLFVAVGVGLVLWWRHLGKKRLNK